MLLTPYELNKMSDKEIEELTYEIRSGYIKEAISPYMLSCNQDVIAQMIQLFTYLSAKYESQYAKEKLKVDFEENSLIKKYRDEWDVSEKGKVPALDYFKAKAAIDMLEKRDIVLNYKLTAQNFKAAADSYKERIAAIKYKINAIAIEENGRTQ